MSVPKRQWFGELTWRPAPAWRISANVKHVGDRAADLANSANVPAYTLIGLNAQYELRPHRTVETMRVQFNASNLANERYLSAADGDQGGTFFLGPARMLSVTLRLEF